MKLSLSTFLSSRPQSAYQYALKNFFSSTTTLFPSLDARCSLYRRISPIGDPGISIVPVLDKWIEEGRSADKVELQTIIKELKIYKRFKHALEISQWMTDTRYIPPSSDDIACRLDLIYKVHGLDKAEKYFNNIPQQMRGYNVYTSLLNSYCLSKSVEKAESTMQKIRDMGYNRSPLSYNFLMKLYYSLGNWEKLDTLMQEMEEKGVRFDKYTYALRLSAYAAASDCEGIDKIVKMVESDPRIYMDTSTCAIAASGYLKVGLVDKALEILNKLEGLMTTSKRRNFAFDFVIRLYAEMGKKDELYRIWNLYQEKMKIFNKGYISMIGSLVKLDDIEGAEKIFEEWESRGLSYDFRIADFLIDAYCRKGEIGKAENLLNQGIAKGASPLCNSWLYLADAYIKDNQFLKAFEALQKAISVCPVNWKPSKDMLVNCLEILERQRDVEETEVEELIQLLKVEGFFSKKIGDKLLNFAKDNHSPKQTVKFMEGK